MSFEDRQFVVTGGAGALGRAVVAALLDDGATCHIPLAVGESADGLDFRSHPKARIVAGVDLTDEAAAARVFDGVPRLWASIHLAGGFAFGPLAEASIAGLRAQIEQNLITCLISCRAAVQGMQRTGEGGRIVNVAARPALEWRRGARMAAYTASKAAVAALTVALAEEVVEHGILVNAVAPSIMDTPANRAAMPKADFSGWPKVEEVRRTILFLASPDNRVTRGAVIPVYGRA